MFEQVGVVRGNGWRGGTRRGVGCRGFGPVLRPERGECVGSGWRLAQEIAEGLERVDCLCRRDGQATRCPQL